MYGFVVVELPSDESPLTLDTLELSDAILRLMHEGDPHLPREPQRRQRVLNISTPVGGDRARFDETGRDSLNMPDDTVACSFLWENGESCSKEHPDRALSRFVPRLARNVVGRQVGLALGGGAAWGIAHLGVLSLLERNDIPIDVVAGTSMGALVGGVYAASGSSGLDEAVARTNTWPKLLSLLDLSFYTSGILQGTNIQRWLRSIIGEVDLEELEVPCWAVANDFDTSQEVTLKRGSVTEAIRASISIPGVFTPHAYQGRLLVDGGVINCVPVTTAKEMGADKVIAVNVIPLPSREDADLIRKFDLPGKDLVGRAAAPPRGGERRGLCSSVVSDAADGLYSLVRGFNVLERFNQMMRCLYTAVYNIAERQSRLGDVVITPEVRGYSWIEFNRIEELVELGERAAESALPAIRSALEES